MNEYAEPGELQQLLGKPDMVNRPPHYTGGEIECIDAIQEATKGLTGMDAYCTGTAIKYLWRWRLKGAPKQDLEKARWYLNKLLESVDDAAS
jgi:hypothetical protein